MFFFLSPARLAFIYLIQSTAKPVKCLNIFVLLLFKKYKWYVFYLNTFLNVIYSCDFKAEFLASLLHSHDHSEIILIFCFALQKYYYY